MAFNPVLTSEPNVNATTEPTPLFAQTSTWMYISGGFVIIFVIAVLILLIPCNKEQRERRRRQRKTRDRKCNQQGSPDHVSHESNKMSLKNEVERLIQKGKLAQMSGQVLGTTKPSIRMGNSKVSAIKTIIPIASKVVPANEQKLAATAKSQVQPASGKSPTHSTAPVHQTIPITPGIEIGRQDDAVTRNLTVKTIVSDTPLKS